MVRPIHVLLIGALLPIAHTLSMKRYSLFSLFQWILQIHTTTQQREGVQKSYSSHQVSINTYSCSHYLLSQGTASAFLNASRGQAIMLAQSTLKPHEYLVLFTPQPNDIIAKARTTPLSVNSTQLAVKMVFISHQVALLHTCSSFLPSDMLHSPQPPYLSLLKLQNLFFPWKTHYTTSTPVSFHPNCVHPCGLKGLYLRPGTSSILPNI